MKRLFVLIIAMLMCCAAASAWEGDVGKECGDCWYLLNADGTARLTMCISSEEICALPSELDGYPLTVIGPGTLWGTSEKVIVPEGVTRIDSYAFSASLMGENCIREVELPYSVEIIGYNPFRGCAVLENVCIPADHPIFAMEDGMLTDMADNRLVSRLIAAGSECIVPEGVEIIGKSAFDDNGVIEKVVLPGSLKQIENFAFNNCISLTDITVPEGVTDIGDYAFDGCEALEYIEIPSSVTCIGRRAFEGYWDEAEYPDGYSEQLRENIALDANTTVICSEGSYCEEYCIRYGIPYAHER